MATSARRRPRKTKATTGERREYVANLKQQLKERLDEWQAEAGDELIALALATHDGYSDRNAMLIAMQCPTATDVAGFKAWIERGRRVRKGEHGIQILAPAGEYRETGDGQRERVKADDPEGLEGDVSRFFRLAYVFDVSQTDPAEQTTTAAASAPEVAA